MAREQLPQRRYSEQITFDHDWPDGRVFRYHATVGYYDWVDPSGTGALSGTRVGEVWLACSKTGTDMEIVIKDSAQVLSLYLQHGGLLEELTFLRRPDGSPDGPLGALIDILTGKRKWLRWEEQPAAVLIPPTPPDTPVIAV